MASRTFIVGYVQNNPRILKVQENIAGFLSLVKGKKADLWVLPEFFATGYNFRDRREVRRVAETVPGGLTTRTLLDFSQKNRCAVAAGLVEKSGGRLYNSGILVSKGKVSLYRKTHLFAREKRLFSPGNTGFWVRRVSGVKVGMMICFDWFFPESARTLALLGAEVILHPANLVLPWGPEGMKLRGLENHVFTVTANRVGLERGLRFIGRSQVTSPKGEVLSRASGGRTLAGVLSIPAASARDKNITAYNHVLKDRRAKLYSIA